MTTAWMRQARMRQRAHITVGDAYQHGGMRDEAKQAYAEWIGQLPWDWFATFTLVLGGRESATYIWRCLERWSAAMHTENGRQLRQVAALEYQKRGTAHLHNLVYGVRQGADPFHAMTIWEGVSGGGFARIYPYEPDGGAIDYCAKYVAKDMELRLIGPWPPYRGPQLW